MEPTRRRRDPIAAVAAAAPPLLLLVLLSLSPTASATAIPVGGKGAVWAANINYTDWSNQTRFFLGDWIVFRWEKGMHDVTRVNGTSYEQCSAADPIFNFSRGNKMAVELNETGRWYFICSRGYCWGGMKFSVLVEPIPPPPASPPSLSSSSAASSSAVAAVTGLIAAAAAGVLFSVC